MALPATVATVKELTVTPLTGTAITVNGILSFKPIIDPELIKDKYSSNRAPVFYQGELVAGCTFTAKDNRLAGLSKGDIITSVSATFNGALKSDGTATSATVVATFALADGVITEDTSPEIGSDGTPSEYTITIMVSQDPTTGADGTCTFVEGAVV